MDQYKSILTSPVFWGLIVGLALPILKMFGVELPQEYIDKLPANLVAISQGILAVIGAVMILLGKRFESTRTYFFVKPRTMARFKATSAIGVFTALRVLFFVFEVYMYWRKLGLSAKIIMERLKKIKEKIGGVEFDDYDLDEIISP